MRKTRIKAVRALAAGLLVMIMMGASMGASVGAGAEEMSDIAVMRHILDAQIPGKI